MVNENCQSSDNSSKCPFEYSFKCIYSAESKRMEIVLIYNCFLKDNLSRMTITSFSACFVGKKTSHQGISSNTLQLEDKALISRITESHTHIRILLWTLRILFISLVDQLSHFMIRKAINHI